MAGPQCGAKNRKGGSCRQPAGFKTDHAGEGKCWLHGGLTPVKHGRYSAVSRPRIRELLAQLDSEPDPSNLLPEAQLIRALLVDFVERYDEMKEALLAWNDEEYAEAAAAERKPRPQAIPDLHEAAILAERAARVVNMMAQQKKDGSLTLESFNRIMEHMGVSVARHVKDATTLGRIEAEWLAIQVI
jgi:hypothetical protein